MARIRPFWCSLGLMRRVPNAMAKAASPSAIAREKRAEGLSGREPRFVERIDDSQERGRNRLELQRDVRRGADQRDQRRNCGDRRRLAVAGRDEVGDGRKVLRAGEIGDAPDERRAETDDEDRADVDRQEVEAVRGGEADRAVIGPRRAIDREAQRVDQRPLAAHKEPPSAPVAPPGDEEQEQHIADCGDVSRSAVHRTIRARSLSLTIPLGAGGANWQSQSVETLASRWRGCARPVTATGAPRPISARSL